MVILHYVTCVADFPGAMFSFAPSPSRARHIGIESDPRFICVLYAGLVSAVRL